MYPKQKHWSQIIPFHLNVSNITQISVTSDTFAGSLFVQGAMQFNPYAAGG